MITLTITTILTTIVLWYFQYKQLKKGVIKSVNPLDETPTLFTALLVVFTLFSVLGIVIWWVYICVCYLP